MRAHLKGLAKARKILADGTARYYCYAWRGGPLLRDSDGKPLQPGDPTLVSAFAAAHEARRNPQSNDLAMLIRQYRLSSDFRTLSASSRREYDRYLDEIWRRFGLLTLDEVQQPATRGKFKEWRDELSDSPRTADYAWTTLARVLSFAKDRGKINANICERGGRLYTADRAEKIWTEKHLTAVRAEASSEMLLALEMAPLDRPAPGRLASARLGGIRRRHTAFASEQDRSPCRHSGGCDLEEAAGLLPSPRQDDADYEPRQSME